MRELVNLHKVLAKLNEHVVFEGEDFGSVHNFCVDTSGGQIKVYDANEAFSLYYDDEIESQARAVAFEFGFSYKKPESRVDKIVKDLETALSKDLNHPVSLEWQDPVVMVACL